MKKLKEDQIKIIVDSREQLPYKFESMKTIKGNLTSGDYSIEGFEPYISLERKSLPDLIGCITTGRERFEKELHRLKAYSKKIVLVEANWLDIINGNYRSKLNPKSASHSIISWINRFNVPFHFAGDRDNAQRFAEYFLYNSVQQLYEIAQKFEFKTA